MMFTFFVCLNCALGFVSRLSSCSSSSALWSDIRALITVRKSMDPFLSLPELAETALFFYLLMQSNLSPSWSSIWRLLSKTVMTHNAVFSIRSSFEVTSSQAKMRTSRPYSCTGAT